MACSSCSPTTSCSPSTATPWSTGSRPNGNDPESCLFELWSISIPAGGRTGPATGTSQGPFAPDDTDHWPRIPLQDFSNIGRQQRGVHSRGFHGPRLSHTYEAGIVNMHRELDRYLAS